MQFSINSILPKIPFYFSHLLLDSPMKPLDLLESEYFKENCIKTPKPILCRPSLSFTILQIWLLTFLINYHLLLNYNLKIFGKLHWLATSWSSKIWQFFTPHFYFNFMNELTRRYNCQEWISSQLLNMNVLK